MSFFDNLGCLGVSELIRCLDFQQYGARVTFFKAKNICVQAQTVLGSGDFTYSRDPKEPFGIFITISKNFEHLTIEEQQLFNAVCLEIAESLNGIGERRLFENIQVAFSVT